MKTTTMPNYIWHSFEYYSFMITSTLARRRLEFSDDSSVLLVFLAAFRPALFTDKFFAFFLPFFLEGRPLLSSSASSVYPLSSDSSEELGTFRWFLVDLYVVFWNDAKGLILRFSFPESSSSSPSSSETSVKQQARKKTIPTERGPRNQWRRFVFDKIPGLTYQHASSVFSRNSEMHLTKVELEKNKHTN